MYVIRHALSTDLTACRRLWATRATRAHNRGSALHALSLTDAECAASELFVLCAEGGQVVGVVAVIDQLPGLGWTDNEGQQEAVGLGAMVTDPLYPSVPLSWVLAYWAEDRAARSGRKWVRAAVPCESLALHWQVACGWQRVRTHPQGPVESVLMQRRAGHNDGIRTLVEDRTADNCRGDVLSTRDLMRTAAESQQPVVRDNGGVGELGAPEPEIPVPADNSTSAGCATIDINDICGHQDAVGRDQADTLVMYDLTDSKQPGRWEQLWAQRLDAERFRLCSIPFFTMNIALGDTFTTTASGGFEHCVDAVTDRSGNVVMHAFFHENTTSRGTKNPKTIYSRNASVSTSTTKSFDRASWPSAARSTPLSMWRSRVFSAPTICWNGETSQHPNGAGRLTRNLPVQIDGARHRHRGRPRIEELFAGVYLPRPRTRQDPPPVTAYMAAMTLCTATYLSSGDFVPISTVRLAPTPPEDYASAVAAFISLG